jgi:MYXO-CTERM domain-containing protein
MRVVLGLVLVLTPLTARADALAPDGLPDCTVQLVQNATQTCETCQGVVTDRDLCNRTEAIRGYAHACTGPNLVEVWCIPTEPALPPLPASATPPAAPTHVERPCDCSAPGAHSSSGGGVLVLALFVPLFVRRRT